MTNLFRSRFWSFLAIGALVLATAAQAQVTPTPAGPDLEVEDARVRYIQELGLLVFEQDVAGEAGGTVPEAAGQMDGAPVLAYVFPTTLNPTAVGFAEVEGTLALVAASHPDFDDTPLWDEDGDGMTGNDGPIFHSHWVVLVEDEQAPGGLAVREIVDEQHDEALPPTHPGMDLYLDSPGFSVVLDGNTIRVLVPAYRVRWETEFSFDAVTAYLEVNMSDEGRPTLGVYEVYSLLSGDLSLPYAVEEE